MRIRYQLCVSMLLSFAALATFPNEGQAQVSLPAFAVHYDLYSESLYLSREDILENATRLRLELPAFAGVTPYVVGGDELYNHSSHLGEPETVDAVSHTYAAPGLKWTWKAVSLFMESRFRQYTKTTADAWGPPLPTHDQRALLVVGLWREIPFGLLHRTRLFGELYSETLFSTADDDNVVHATFVRPGVRFEPLTHLYLDAFVKPFFTLDRAHHDYNNRAELEGGLRAVKVVNWMSFSLAASYLVNRNFRYAATPTSKVLPKQGYRILAVVGGAT